MLAPPEDELDELIARFLSELDRGNRPDPIDWMARHPHLAVGFADFLKDLSRFAPDGSEHHSDPSLFETQDFPTHADPVSDRTQAVGESGPAIAQPVEAQGPEAAPIETIDFGDYELIGPPIGRGGMGIVHRARLKGTRVIVALKRITAEAARDGYRHSEEIEAAASLRHPHIVPVYHAGEFHGEPYFTMALVEGGHLGSHLQRLCGNRRLTAELMIKVSRAVHYAHQRRILHRDLKPSNILLDANLEPHVADFGLAAKLTDSGCVEPGGKSGGSLPWMAPEMLPDTGDTPRKDAFEPTPVVTTAVDVWALGVILYELLTGNRPFHDTSPIALRDAIRETEPIPPTQINPAIPKDLEAVTMRCLQKDPAQRYESASAVALDLERWLRDEPVRARRHSPWERLLRWARRTPAAAAGLITAAALLSVLSIGSLRLIGTLRSEVLSDLAADCEYDADHVAANVATRFDQLGGELLRTANNLATLPVHDATSQPTIEARLRSLLESPIPPGMSRPFATVIVLNAEGKIVFVGGPESPPSDRSYDRRDYFSGATQGKVYVSRAYRSELDGHDKIALATRFRFADSQQDWVLLGTITTSEQLEMGSVTMSNSRNTAILVAKQDDDSGISDDDDSAHIILIHPALKASAPSVRFDATENPPSHPRPFPSDPDYHDPFATIDQRFAGRWLTEAARVGKTHLSVVVQAKVAEAFAPFTSFGRRIAIAIAIACALGVISFFVLLVLKHRHTLRR
jgi:serine/threonine protein kinase